MSKVAIPPYNEWRIAGTIGGENSIIIRDKSASFNLGVRKKVNNEVQWDNFYLMLIGSAFEYNKHRIRSGEAVICEGFNGTREIDAGGRKLTVNSLICTKIYFLYYDETNNGNYHNQGGNYSKNSAPPKQAQPEPEPNNEPIDDDAVPF